jgi:hypothetical protein
MHLGYRLAAYGVALAVSFGAAWAAGYAIGPVAASPPAAHDGTAVAHGDTAAGPGGTAAQAARTQPGGLASSANGYTFAPVRATLTPGVREEFAFRISGPDGAAVTTYDVEHDKRMHLIVVRRDTTGFQHVHPELGADGVWRVSLTLPAAGSYRAFADFKPSVGTATTLGVDLSAPGRYDPQNHEPTRVAQVDGYRVELAGDLTAGQSSRLLLRLYRDGQPVTDLQPYLAAYGHLVALREGNLAYLHVHPDGAPGDGRTAAGPEIVFYAEVPTAGSYRLFLDFQHAGVVRTAEFTVATAGNAAQPVPAAPPEHQEGPNR